MAKTLIHGARIVDPRRQLQGDVLIEDTRIAAVGRIRPGRVDTRIDGRGKILIPGLVNTHTHAAMTLLRGYADDMELKEWLTKRIWPQEQKLTGEDVHRGAKLAALEMIRSGTTAFNDMYFHEEAAARAASELGIRATVSETYLDGFRSVGEPGSFERAKARLEPYRNISAALGPHAPYTVSLQGLQECARLSKRHRVRLHFHLAETEREVRDFKRKNRTGIVEALDRIGFLSSRLVAAHAIWLDPQEIRLLGRRKVNVSHCPISNMKLCSGAGTDGRRRAFDYRAMQEAGVNVTLGTDGTASNNSLDMFETMKVASLLQKHDSGDPTRFPAHEVFAAATVNGARALGIDAGRIEPGALADLVLLDGSRACFSPGHDPIADLVYALRGDCVETVLIDGRVVMRDGSVPGEKRIIAEAREVARDLVRRRPRT